MPLRVIDRNGWKYLRGTVRGIPCYEACGTKDAGQAEAARAVREAELFEAALFGERAVVAFRAAALSYLRHAPRSPRTESHVNRLIKVLGARKVSAITQAAADEAVIRIVGSAAAPATKRRNVYAPLTAILNHAARRGWCDTPSFDLPRPAKGKTAWLAPRQALALLEACAPHLRPIVHFILCTGARMSEAIELQWADVDLQEARVVFRGTKGGRDRVARLPPRAVITLSNLPGRAGHVFRRDDGEPYTDRARQQGGQIRSAWRTACRDAGLPGQDRTVARRGFVTWRLADGSRRKGRRAEAQVTLFAPEHTPHDLRHTWASWFYAVTKDPMLLKDEGGWASLAMVERYAHLMPSELAPDVSLVWGASHPRIGALPGGAPSVQRKLTRSKRA